MNNSIPELVNSSVFCPAPWSNVDVSPQGVIAPCCKAVGFPTVRITETTLAEYTQTPALEQMKASFLAGAWPAECVRCQREEANGVQSKRQLDVERWQHIFETLTVETLGPVSASISVGNVCNLRCRICSSTASSAWRAEEPLVGRRVQPISKYAAEALVLADLKQLASQVYHIDFPGGEPFYTDRETQNTLLDTIIQAGRAHEVTLHYTTNGTVWPAVEFWARWKHFKEVDIQVSVDGVGAHFEYQRFPASWDVVYANLKRYQSKLAAEPYLKLSIAHTLSIFTVFYLPDFLKWCLRERLPKPWVGRLNTPYYLAPGIFPAESKAAVSAKLKYTSWADEVYNNDMSAHLPEFFEKTQVLDQNRQQSFADTFPETYQLLKGKS